VIEKIRKNRRVIMSELSTHFLHFFAAEWFSSDDEVTTAVQHWVKTLVADFFDEGDTETWAPIWQMSQFGCQLCREVAKSM
jgi:hypothetical protein